MNSGSRKTKLGFCWLAGIIILLCISNRFLGWQEAIKFLSLGDVSASYEVIAKAAPGWPPKFLVFHQAQRFAFPYAIGLASKVTAISLPTVFAFATAILTLVLLAGLQMFMAPWQPQAALCLCFAAFQPYFLRYYFIATGMSGDLLFQASLLAIIASLYLVKPRFLLIAGVMSVLARQTGVMLLPGVLFFLVTTATWNPRRYRFGLAALYAVTCLSTYVLTGLMAKSFAEPSQNLEILFGIFYWARSPEFSIRELAEHSVRIFLPLAPLSAAIAMASPARTLPKEERSLLLLAAGIVVQPFLSGPGLTGANAGRLATLALLPLVVCLARTMPQFSKRAMISLVVVLFLGSFHHLYTYVGPRSAAQTALLQLFVVALVVIISRQEKFRRASGASVGKSD